jgi:hypothetical protein
MSYVVDGLTGPFTMTICHLLCKCLCSRPEHFCTSKFSAAIESLNSCSCFRLQLQVQWGEVQGDLNFSCCSCPHAPRIPNQASLCSLLNSALFALNITLAVNNHSVCLVQYLWSEYPGSPEYAFSIPKGSFGFIHYLISCFFHVTPLSKFSPSI